jgi:hypothetical protein
MPAQQAGLRPTFGASLHLGYAPVSHPTPMRLDNAGDWAAGSLFTGGGALNGGFLLPFGTVALAMEVRLGFGFSSVSLDRVGPAPTASASPLVGTASLRPLFGQLSSGGGSHLSDGEGGAIEAHGVAALRASAEWSFSEPVGAYVFGQIGAPGPTLWVGVGLLFDIPGRRPRLRH